MPMSVSSTLRCCAGVVLLAAICVALLPWLSQRLLFYLLHLCDMRGQPCFKPKGAVHLPINLVKGMPMSPFITDRRIEELETSFPHQSGDIWVATYPKVGTHWTQAMVVAILGNPLTYDFKTMCPWPEVASRVFSDYAQLSNLKNNSVARCFKSHWPYRDHMARLPASSKVIYVTRQVDKLLESYWHHHHDMFLIYQLNVGDISWDQYFEAFLDGELDFGDYFEHIATWWPFRNNSNVLWLRYEDMKDNHPEAVRRISSFLGIQLDDKRVEEVVRLTSIDHMKTFNEQDPVLRLMRTLGLMKGHLIREGRRGGETRVTAAQRARLQKRFDVVLKPLGVPQDMVFTS